MQCIHLIYLPNHYLRDNQCWSSASPQTVTPALTWDFTMEFIANNFDFPVFLLKDTRPSDEPPAFPAAESVPYW